MKITNSRITFDKVSIFTDADGVYIDGKVIASSLNVDQHLTDETPTGYKYAIFPYARGSVYGYVAGGVGYSGATSPNFYRATQIDRFKFTNDFAETDTIADLTVETNDRTASASCAWHGLRMGGKITIPTNTISNGTNKIERYFFASQTDAAANPVNLSGGVAMNAAGVSGALSGYRVNGGYTGTPYAYMQDIDEVRFSSQIPIASPSTLIPSTQLGSGMAGHQSSLRGYHSGGYIGPTATNQPVAPPGVPAAPSVALIYLRDIWSFPFATASDGTTYEGYIGLDPVGRFHRSAGVSSETYGYICGGFQWQNTPTNPSSGVAYSVSDYYKFPFIVTAAETVGTFVGDLEYPKYDATGVQSMTDGYVLGGHAPPASPWESTNGTADGEKFPFANETTIAHSAHTRLGSGHNRSDFEW